MSDNDNAPVEEGGQAADVSQETPSPEPSESGQGEGAEAPKKTEGKTYKSLEELAESKGWDAEKANEQIIRSYQDLERKMGSLPDVTEKAAQYDQLAEKYNLDQIDNAFERAAAYERAQEYIENLRTQEQIQSGQTDLTSLSVNQLGQLWQNGQIGLADMPADKQAQVLSHMQNEQLSFERAAQEQARQLQEEFPAVFSNDRLASIAADLIERGQTDSSGRELSPHEIVQNLQEEIQKAEKLGEERIRKDTEEIKKGNLERTDSPASTKPNKKVESIYDAFAAAKDEIEGV